PARRASGRELRPSAAARAHPAQGDEGGVAPVRAELLPALPSRRAHGAAGGHLDLAPGISLHRPALRRRRHRGAVQGARGTRRARARGALGTGDRDRRRTGGVRIPPLTPGRPRRPRGAATRLARLRPLAHPRPRVHAGSRHRSHRDRAHVGGDRAARRDRIDPHLPELLPRARSRSRGQGGLGRRRAGDVDGERMTTSDELAEQRTGLANLRSHLANERTHLAYLRTAVSLISFGITLNRFSIYLRENRGLSPEPTRLLLRNTENVVTGLVVLGLVLMVWALHRFWRVSEDIERARHVPRYRAVLLLTLGLIFLGGLSALWLLGL